MAERIPHPDDWKDPSWHSRPLVYDFATASLRPSGRAGTQRSTRPIVGTVLRWTIFCALTVAALVVSLLLGIRPTFAASGDNYPDGVGSNGITFSGGVPVAAPAGYHIDTETIYGYFPWSTPGCGSTTRFEAGTYVVADTCPAAPAVMLLWAPGDNTTVPAPSASPTPTSTGTSAPSASPTPTTAATPTAVTLDEDTTNVLRYGMGLLVLISAAGLVTGWARGR